MAILGLIVTVIGIIIMALFGKGKGHGKGGWGNRRRRM